MSLGELRLYIESIYPSTMGSYR